ncbi:hypothetical protein Dimus_005765, partial [Dionaea muscipula]
ARTRGRPSSAHRLLSFTARARGGLLIGCLRTPHAQQAGARMHGQLVLDDGRETHVWSMLSPLFGQDDVDAFRVPP